MSDNILNHTESESESDSIYCEDIDNPYGDGKFETTNSDTSLLDTRWYLVPITVYSNKDLVLNICRHYRVKNIFSSCDECEIDKFWDSVKINL